MGGRGPVAAGMPRPLRLAVRLFRRVHRLERAGRSGPALRLPDAHHR